MTTAPLQTAAVLRTISSPEEVHAVTQAAHAAGNSCIAPTHIIERDGQAVGYASLAAVPILTGWLHEEHISQPEGHRIIAELEAEARRQGLPFLCFPCTDDCRFKPDMTALGYRKSKTVTFYLKPLE